MLDIKIFHPITMDDKEWIEKITKNEYLEICDQTFGMSFAGRYTYNIQVANVSGCVVYKYDEGELHSFSYPIGKNSKEALIDIVEYIKYSSDDIQISPMSFTDKQEFESLSIDGFMIEPYYDYFDYVYLTENLKNLAGKKYAAKRNHINRFVENTSWSVEELSKENAYECIQLEKHWRQTKEDMIEFSDDDMKRELINEEIEIRRSLENLNELGFFGIIIRREDIITAFSICEEQNKDTVIVHYEKADANIQGAYQIVNRETAALIDRLGYKYVNREDDLGISGLRKAKQSYYPYYMGRKYGAFLSEFSFATLNDISNLKLLWKQAFNDEDEYINEYFECLTDKNAINEKWLHEAVIIHKSGTVLQAMGSFFDAVTARNEKVKYVYGLATDIDYRKKGLCKRMLLFAKNYFNCPLVLKPQDEKVASMYGKMGFVRLHGSEQFNITDEIVKASNIIDKEDYTKDLMILY